MSGKLASLSDPMAKALADAHDGGESRLYRWPGGFWMPRQKTKSEQAVFKTWTGTQTVQALIRRGYLEPVAHLQRGEPWIVKLTAAALVIIQAP